MRCLQDTARVVLALWFVFVPLKAWAGNPMLLGAGAPSGAAAATVSFVASASEASAGTSINYGTLSFGAAATNRIIAIATFNRPSGGGSTISSVSIGGVSASQASGAYAIVAAGLAVTDIWYASVPTGTTGNVTVTWNTATVRTGVAVYRITTNTPAPAAAGTNNSASATSLSTSSYTVPANGVSIGIVGVRNAGGTTSISGGVTQDVVIASLGGAGSSLAAGSSASSGSQTATGATTSGSGEMVISAAAWGP